MRKLTIENEKTVLVDVKEEMTPAQEKFWKARQEKVKEILKCGGKLNQYMKGNYKTSF